MDARKWLETQGVGYGKVEDGYRVRCLLGMANDGRVMDQAQATRLAVELNALGLKAKLIRVS